jgi:anti-anti-sigma factor
MATAVVARAFFGQVDSTTVLKLTGQIRYIAARELKSFIDQALARPDLDTFILDLREVELIDSTGMGMLARLGRFTLERHGRRAVLVCPVKDVVTSLRSACFDTLFLMEDHWPLEQEPQLEEVPLGESLGAADRSAGYLILDAHRDLAAMSDINARVFGGVVAALEQDLRKPAH